MRALADDHLSPGDRSVKHRIPIQPHFSLAGSEGADEDAVAAQDNVWPRAKDIEKDVVPLQAAGQEDFCALGQRKLVRNVDDEGRGRVSEQSQRGMAAERKVLEIQSNG